MRIVFLSSLLAATAITCAQGRAVPVGGGQSDTPKPPKAPAARAAEEDRRALQLLQLAMGRVPSRNVQAIISQRLDYASRIFQQIKVEMSKDGKLHQFILTPLDYQGVELVDDGTSMRTYTPDDKRIIVQPSARDDSDVRERMALVRRNYTVRLDRHEKIAGRDAAVIMAVPKNDDLETRCYAVDESTGFLLRLETCKEGSPPVLHFETKVVSFPGDFPQGTFTISASFVKIDRYDRKCVSPQAANELVEELGFRPVVPTKLPYGFAVQQLQAATDSRPTALAVRVSDGLAKATVIEWVGDRSMGENAPKGTRVNHNGQLTLLISGDMPDDVKDRILNAFVRVRREPAAWKLPAVTLSWAQELRCDINVFPLDREPQRSAPYSFAFQMRDRN